MQFRELSRDEILGSHELLLELYPDLDIDYFSEFLERNEKYKALTAIEGDKVIAYTGITSSENLRDGSVLTVQEFISLDKNYTKEMLDFIYDYAKLYRYKKIVLKKDVIGLDIKHLGEYAPERGIFYRLIY